MDIVVNDALSVDKRMFRKKGRNCIESQVSRERLSKVGFSSPRVVRTRSRICSSATRFFSSNDRFQARKLDKRGLQSSNCNALHSSSSSDLRMDRQNSILSGSPVSYQESTVNNKMPTMTLLRKQLRGLLPIEEHDTALRTIFTKFPDIMSGSPPLSEVLAVVTGGALYTYFARAAVAKVPCQSE